MKQNIALKLRSAVLYLMVIAYIIVVANCAWADTVTYSYYDTGELRKSVYTCGATVEYVYDASGNRTSKAVSSAKPVISLSPTSWDFGTVMIGYASTVKTFVVNNTGTGQLDIENVIIGGTDANLFSKQADHCTGLTLTPAGTCNIDIVFNPDYPEGSKSATLTVVSDAPDNPNMTASINGYSTATQMFSLSITTNGTGSGGITVDTGTLTNNGNTYNASYSSSTLVHIYANPESNSSFTSWSGDCLGNGSPCSLQVNGVKTVTATFDSKADFSANPIAGSAPLVVNFTDASTNTPTAWQWSFGDNGSSTVQNPIYTYLNPGTYSVSLTSTGVGGAATRAKSNLITVTSCGNNPVHLDGTSYYDTSIQSVYNAATSGESVLIQAIPFSEPLNLQSSTAVTLQGGFGCDFFSNIGFTTIEGTVTISGGAVTIGNLIVQ